MSIEGMWDLVWDVANFGNIPDKLTIKSLVRIHCRHFA